MRISSRAPGQRDFGAVQATSTDLDIPAAR
jgi:hypothetical protein